MCASQQNLGAILRSAHFLGASGVLCCAKNSAPLSPVVAKASAGALDAMPLYACGSMPRFLTAAAEAGWSVVGECCPVHHIFAPLAVKRAQSFG